MSTFLENMGAQIMVIIGTYPIKQLKVARSNDGGVRPIPEESDLTVYYKDTTQLDHARQFVDKAKQLLLGMVKFELMQECIHTFPAMCYKLKPDAALQATRFFLLPFFRQAINLVN